MIIPNFDFQEKFGHIFNLVPDGGLTYEKQDSKKLYSIPSTTKEKDLQDLMTKSLKDNFDYVFELVKRNPKELNPNFLY